MDTRLGGLLAALLILGGTLSFVSAQDKGAPRSPVRVKIQDEKPVFSEASAAIDPQQRVQLGGNGFYLQVSVEGKSLHLGPINPTFKIDQNVGMGVQMEIMKTNLPHTPAGKARDGFLSAGRIQGIHITQTVEVVATRAAKGQLRRRDAVLVRYTLENKDNVTHRVGLRCFMDVLVAGNDGALFAAPNQPGKILDGVELKDRTMPDYIQFLQRADLKNPGFVGHLTCNLGSSVEGPNRAVLTRLGAGGNAWDLIAAPARGDSAMAFYWDPREIKPGAKRELAYAFGQGLAMKLEGEGTIKLDLIGSFEPNKMFTINALVSEPAPRQSLTLELPDGLERLEGKETQPVPAADADGICLVQWKARVPRLGRYNLRVHSSTGMTQTKIITVTKDER